jgi:hypothetical protein
MYLQRCHAMSYAPETLPVDGEHAASRFSRGASPTADASPPECQRDSSPTSDFEVGPPISAILGKRRIYADDASMRSQHALPEAAPNSTAVTARRRKRIRCSEDEDDTANNSFEHSQPSPEDVAASSRSPSSRSPSSASRRSESPPSISCIDPEPDHDVVVHDLMELASGDAHNALLECFGKVLHPQLSVADIGAALADQLSEIEDIPTLEALRMQGFAAYDKFAAGLREPPYKRGKPRSRWSPVTSAKREKLFIMRDKLAATLRRNDGKCKAPWHSLACLFRLHTKGACTVRIFNIFCTEEGGRRYNSFTPEEVLLRDDRPPLNCRGAPAKRELAVHHCNAYIFGFNGCITGGALTAQRGMRKNLPLIETNHFNHILYWRNDERTVLWNIERETYDQRIVRLQAIGESLWKAFLLPDDEEHVLRRTPVIASIGPPAKTIRPLVITPAAGARTAASTSNSATLQLQLHPLSAPYRAPMFSSATVMSPQQLVPSASDAAAPLSPSDFEDDEHHSDAPGSAARCAPLAPHSSRPNTRSADGKRYVHA